METKTVSGRKLEPGYYIKIAYNTQESVILEDQRIRDKAHLEKLQNKGLERAEVIPQLHEAPRKQKEGSVAVEDLTPNYEFEGAPTSQAAPSAEELKENLEATSSDFERIETLGENTLTKVKDVLGSIKRREEVDPDELEPYSEMLTDEISSNPSLAVMLTTFEQATHTIFQHSINVAVHTIHWGKYRGYTDDELKLLGKAGLLHDAGKMEMNEILSKEEPLTDEEYEKVKEHPTKGGGLLEELGCSPPIPRVALEHHERPGGNGYPLAKEVDELHPYSRMVSLVDVYDAIVSKRVYSDSEHPLKAIQVLKDEFGENETARTLFHEFIQFNGYFPPGAGVELNNGYRGIVVEQNINAPMRPRVSLVEGPARQPLDNPISVDLETIEERKRIIQGDIFDNNTTIESVLAVKELKREKSTLMEEILAAIEATEPEE